jgi:hypothetical protein
VAVLLCTPSGFLSLRVRTRTREVTESLAVPEIHAQWNLGAGAEMLTADEGYAGSSSAGSRRLWPGAAFVPPRAEREVVDQQLRAAAEQLRQRRRAIVSVEDVFLIHPYPGQFVASSGELVAATSKFLLRC